MLDLALQPKQLQMAYLFRAIGPEVATILGFGGARGGGKSRAVRDIALALELTDGKAGKPSTSIILRRVYDDVKRNHIDPFFAEYPALRDYYRVADHELILPARFGGGKIVFGYAETAAEVTRKFWGVEYKRVFVDQAEQFSGAELQTIKTSNRWPGADIGECKTGHFFNPGGIGTAYLRRVYWLKQYEERERASDFSFIQAYGWDNFQWFREQVGLSEAEFYDLPNEERFQLFITKTQYGRDLNSLPQSLRAGHLLGSFESFAGQYYAGVWDESRVILSMTQAERLIQPWWVRWTSTDWGFAHYACHLWFAAGKVSPRDLRDVLNVESEYPLNVVVVYRELVTSETPEADLAARMVEMTPAYERKTIQRHFLSPDAWAKRGSANTVAEQMQPVLNAGGLPSPEKADDDRIGGWRLLYDGFRRSCAVKNNSFVEEAQDLPCLFISPNCPEVISGMPMLTRDPKKLEDVLKVPGEVYDDVGDSLRYGYKSMLDPHSKAPRDVRAKEVYHSISGDSDDAMTERAMAMLKFNQENPAVQRLGRPRWRTPER